MTYFGVLGTFILPPLLLLALIGVLDFRRARRAGEPLPWVPYAGVLGLVVVAVVYTTPWDNYLVATNVWWYDEALVTGITLGYVPIEEYTFFVLQTLLTGLWLAFLWRRMPGPTRTVPTRSTDRPGVRRAAVVVSGGLWLVFAMMLVSGWQPGRYLALIMAWALVPVIIQLAYGADLLLAHWRPVLAGISAPTLYLWVVDYLAIQSGTWTIDPAQTTGLMVGVLPVEEMTFFLMTNILIVGGVTLVSSAASQARLLALWRSVRARRGVARRLSQDVG